MYRHIPGLLTKNVTRVRYFMPGNLSCVRLISKIFIT